LDVPSHIYIMMGRNLGVGRGGMEITPNLGVGVIPLRSALETRSSSIDSLKGVNLSALFQPP
jgi:hypothetical protein